MTAIARWEPVKGFGGDDDDDDVVVVEVACGAAGVRFCVDDGIMTAIAR